MGEKEVEGNVHEVLKVVGVGAEEVFFDDDDSVEKAETGEGYEEGVEED